MKFCLFIIFFYKIAAFPVADDRMYFPDELEKNQSSNDLDFNNPEFNDLETRFDDDTSDLKLDLSSLMNDSNILKSDNDTTEFLFEELSEGKPQYGDLYQGDIELMPEQIKILNSTGGEADLAHRTGLISAVYRWPKDRRGNVNVPYIISSNDYCEYRSPCLVLIFKWGEKVVVKCNPAKKVSD